MIVSVFFSFLLAFESNATPQLRYLGADMVSSAVCFRGNDMCMFARDIVQMAWD